MLLIILVINSVIGLFYYLRVVIALYTKPIRDIPSEKTHPSLGPSFSWIGACAAAVVFVFLIYLGIAPGAFIRFIQTIMHQ